jgi:hypothetical protein
MKTTASLSMPDATSAVVRFMRPSRFVGAARDFAILDGEKAIGTLSNGSQFGYVTTPGKHLFITPGLGSRERISWKPISCQARHTMYSCVDKAMLAL